MFKGILNKFKESAISVAPVAIIVFILALTPITDFSATEIITFAICAVFMIVGITLFNMGADMAMTPMGEQIGSGLTKSRKISLLTGIAFIMGILITIAEPDLSVLANQVSAIINETVLIVLVGLSVGLFLLIAVIKVVFKKDLANMLFFSYLLTFALAAILIERGKGDMLALAFDSGGVTTGPITVPFIMALGVGIATIIGGKHANENSFGLIALCSVGPMIAVMFLSLGSNGTLTYVLPDYSLNLANIGHVLLKTFLDVLKALGLIVVFFFILQYTVLKLPKTKLTQIGVGIGFTFVGLIIFLMAVEIGFMPIGFKLGQELAKLDSYIIVISGFVLGAVVVLAEPAVHILNKQVEGITEGTVTRKQMLIALSAGVGISIGLSMIRIIFNFSILYYLVPGYIISLVLSFFIPKIYTAIAFDSGGVASGPLTSSFILPLAIGVCSTLEGEQSVLSLGFGIVAMVAMAPLITIQILGFRAIAARTIRAKLTMKRILEADDEQIIDFM